MTIRITECVGNERLFGLRDAQDIPSIRCKVTYANLVAMSWWFVLQWARSDYTLSICDLGTGKTHLPLRHTSHRERLPAKQEVAGHCATPGVLNKKERSAINPGPRPAILSGMLTFLVRLGIQTMAAFGGHRLVLEWG